MPEFANRLDAIPLVATTAERGTLFPTPSTGQRVQNLETGRFERYTGSAWVSLPSIDSAVSVTDYGAIGDGDVANAAVNVTAFRAAIVAAAAGKKNLYIPAGIYRVNDNMTFDGACSGMTVWGDGPSSVLKLATTMDEDGNIECGWTIILDGASNGALENFRLSGIRVDGNRSGISGFDVLNTCNLIVGYPDSSFHNVQVDHCTAHSALLGSGFLTYAAGIDFVDCLSYDNDYHGGGCTRAVSGDFGDADKWVRFTNFTAHDNGQATPFDGCGLDVGRYCRTIVTNLHSYWNGQGMKFSTGTEALVVRGARLAYNLFNGFQDTDTTVGTAVLDLDGIVTHNNGGVGFRLVSGSSVRIGSINSYDNYCRTGATRSGNSFTGGSLQGCDVLIGTSNAVLPTFSADYIRSKGSPSVGILIDGNVRSYRIGYIEAVESETAGFSDAIGGSWVTATAYIVGDIRHNNSVSYLCTSAHTSGGTTEPGVGGSWTTVWKVVTISGVVESGLLVSNNDAGTATAGSACALIVERPGAMHVQRVVLMDDQATPTQHSGMYFSSAVQAKVSGCHFGNGMVAGQEIYSATTGTSVKFGHDNTGTLVTQAKGSATANGGAGTASVTYPTAISNLGGLVVTGVVYPTSADAAEANYISTLNRTTLTLTCPTTFGGGAGTVTFQYDVQAEVQR